MRTLNLRFAAGLALIVTLLGLGAFVAHRAQSRRIADDMLWQVRRARDAGQPDDAVRLAYAYLEYRPDDTGLLLELAGWLQERPGGGRKHLNHVAALLDRVLQVEPGRSDVRRQLVTLKLRTGRHGECLDHLTRLLAESANDSELLSMQGVCQDAIGKHAEAAESFELALKTDPKRIETSVEYAELLYRRLHRSDDARRVLERAVAANPENAPARLAMARFWKGVGKLAEADAAVKHAVRLAPQDLAVLTAAADIAQACGRFSQAREYMQSASAVAPKNGRIACSLAWLLLYEGKTAEAVAKLQQSLKENPADADALTLLGDMLALDGRIDALAAVVDDLDRLRKSVPERAWNADYLRARLLMQRSDFEGARAQLEQIRQTSARNAALIRQVNYLLAQCCQQTGDRAAELDAYRRILQADAQAAYFRLEFARSLARGGDFGEAVKEFRAAVQRPELPPRAVADAAWDLADRCRRAGADGALKDLERSLEAVRADDASPNAVMAKLTLLRRRQRYGDALNLVTAYLARHANHATMLAERVRLIDAVWGPDRAATALTEAERRLGDHADFRIARLRLLATRPEPGHGARVLANAAGADKLSTDDRTRVLIEVVAAAAMVGDPSAYAQALQTLAGARPDFLPVRAAMLSQALARDDGPCVAQILAQVTAIEGPNGHTGRLFEVERLLKHASTEPAAVASADAILNDLARSRPTDPLIAFFRGRCAELRNDVTSAKKYYADALDAGLLDQPIEEHVAALAQADATSRKVRVFVEESPLFDRLRLETDRPLLRALLPLAPASSRAGLADRLIRSNAEASPPNLVWLARQFGQVGLARHAEACLVRATQLAPLSDETWAARIGYHLARQEPAKVAEVIEQARKLQGPESAVVLGKALDAAGLTGDAMQELQRALSRDPGNSAARRRYVQLLQQTGKLAESRQHLQVIIDQPKVNADDLAWARRTLAMSLTVAPSLAAFQQSLALLEANRRGGAAADDDLRALATVYAAQRSRPLDGGTTARRRAIELLKQLEARSPVCQVDDLLLQARLYQAESDGPALVAVCQRLAGQFPDNPLALGFLTREALRCGSLAEAETHLNRLEKVDGKRFETLALRFTLLALAGQAEQACAVLDAHIDAAPTGPARAARQVRSGHAGSELLCGYPLAHQPAAANVVRDAAIRWYTAGMGRDPQALLRLVALHCKAGRTDQALDLLQTAAVKSNFTVEAQAAAAVTALHAGRPTPQQDQAVERFLADLVRRNPASLALQLAQADLFDHLGKSELAVAAYRRVLAKDPDNAMALNNLAWTLSYDRDKMPEAVRLIAEAIDRNGPLDELLDTRGRVLCANGQVDAGLRDLTEAASSSPSASRYFYLAVMYRRADKPELARQALQQAQRYGLDPGDLHPRDAGDYRELLTRN